MPKSNVKWHRAEVDALKDIYTRWPIDGTEFTTRIPRHTELACRRLAGVLGLTARRSVAPLFTEVTREQWIWLAGFMDGEGCFHVQTGQRQTSRATFKNVSIILVNTHIPTMDFVGKTWPGASRVIRDKNPDWKLQHSLTWSRKTLMIEMVEGLLPFLVTKQDDAQMLLAEAKVWVSRYETGTATMQQTRPYRIYESLEEIEALRS